LLKKYLKSILVASVVSVSLFTSFVTQAKDVVQAPVNSGGLKVYPEGVTMGQIRKAMDKNYLSTIKVTKYKQRLGKEYKLLRNLDLVRPEARMLVDFVNGAMYDNCGYSLPIKDLLKLKTFDSYLALLGNLIKTKKSGDKKAIKKSQVEFDKAIKNMPCLIK